VHRLASALAVAMVGCSAGPGAIDDEDAAAAPAPRVELGTGEVSFVPIAESGATLELVHGPQGGYHVLVSVRVWDLDLDRVSLVYEVSAGTRALSRTPFVLEASRFAREGDHVVRTGDFAILDVTGPEDVAGQDVLVRVTATADDGSSATDARTVTVVDEI
jgi:hypothetical protein